MYLDVRKILCHEFKPSPQVYLEKFNNIFRQSEETCVLFTSHLNGLLDYYVSSRHINGNYDQLWSLLISDKIKNTLPDGWLRHILSVEAATDNGWLNHDKLAECVDLYFANHWRDKPHPGAVGEISSTQKQANGITKASGAIVKNNIANAGKACFHCGSVSHLIGQCTQRPGNRSTPALNSSRSNVMVSNSNRSAAHARVNRCTATKKQSQSSVHESVGQLIVMDRPVLVDETAVKINKCQVVASDASNIDAPLNDMKPCNPTVTLIMNVL